MIAIVDDHHDSRDAIADLARSLGYTAVSFQSADAFLNSGRVGEVTCLIADILMPGKNGLDLHRELLARGHRMPVIFTSGLPQSQDDYPGAVGFLNKPFHDEALIKCLKRACGEPVGQS